MIVPPETPNSAIRADSSCGEPRLYLMSYDFAAIGSNALNYEQNKKCFT